VNRPTYQLVYKPDMLTNVPTAPEYNALASFLKKTATTAYRQLISAKIENKPVIVLSGSRQKVQARFKKIQSVHGQTAGAEVAKLSLRHLHTESEQQLVKELSWQDILTLESKLGPFTSKQLGNTAKPTLFIQPKQLGDPAHIPAFPTFKVTYCPLLSVLIVQFNIVIRSEAGVALIHLIHFICFVLHLLKKE